MIYPASQGMGIHDSSQLHQLFTSFREIWLMDIICTMQSSVSPLSQLIFEVFQHDGWVGWSSFAVVAFIRNNLLMQWCNDIGLQMILQQVSCTHNYLMCISILSLIIPSSTSQKIYPLFLFYSHIITYYFHIILCALFLQVLISRKTLTWHIIFCCNYCVNDSGWLICMISKMINESYPHLASSLMSLFVTDFQ